MTTTPAPSGGLQLCSEVPPIETAVIGDDASGLGPDPVFLGVLLIPGIPVLAQAAAFIVLGFVSIQVYRKWFRARERQSDQPALNRRTAALVGRAVTLEHAIVDGRGRVQIADAYWEVSGPDLPAGAPVRIVGGDAMSLQVEAA